MPKLMLDLPAVLEMLREVGCMTVLETAGSGGTLESLAPSLPHVDVYVPSYAEARNQTGKTHPIEMVETYRMSGACGVVGVKLGAAGAVISPAADEILSIDSIQPPWPLVDTTGPAGYVTGMLKGLTPEESGRLAAAAGACCVIGIGGGGGLRDFEQTAKLARLVPETCHRSVDDENMEPVFEVL